MGWPWDGSSSVSFSRFTYGVYKQNSTLVCLNAKMPNKGISVDISPFYGTLNENQLLRTQQNQEGDTDIPFLLSGYTYFWQEIRCRFSKPPNESIPVDFPPIYLRYIERKSAIIIEGTTKPRGGGYRYTVYCHGIPLSGKNTISLFILTEFFTT